VTTVDNDGTTGVPRVILTSTYDTLSRRTAVSASINGTADFLNSYSYDALHRLTRVDQTGQTGGNTVAEKRVDFAYNIASQYTSIARYKDTDGGSTHEVATSEFSYDTVGRLTGLAYKKGGTNLFTPYAFTYDALNRTELFTSADGTADYDYDAASQVVYVDNSVLNDELYSFDLNGNRTMTGFTTGQNNQMAGDGVFTYEYDDDGHRTKRTRVSTDPADDKVTEYAWDHRGRLISVTYKNNSDDVTKLITYRYDVFDRRIERKLDATSPIDLADAAIESYVYDGDDVVLDFADPDGGGEQQYGLRRRYQHAAGVDQVMAQEDVSLSPSHDDRVLWQLVDRLGSTRDLARSNGTLAAHYKFDTFGKVLSGSSSTALTRYLFTGRELDPETGLQYNRARYYDPAVGRWISEDPLGFAAGDTNLSRYVGNGSTNWIDPTGLDIDPTGLEQMINGPAPPPPPGSYDDLYNRYFFPWNNPEPVDWFDSAVIAVEWIGFGMAVGGGGAAAVVSGTGIGAGVSAGSAVSAAGTFLATEAVDTAVETTSSALGGPPIIPVSPVDLLTDVGRLAVRREIKEEVHELLIDGTKYPQSARHAQDAIDSGVPPVGVVDRSGARARRRGRLESESTVPGMDRDEFPPAVLDNDGGPFSVRPISPSDNRGAGASMGHQLDGIPDGDPVVVRPINVPEG